MPQLSPEDVEAIAQRVIALQIEQASSLGIDLHQHRQDHEWVREKRVDEAEGTKSRRKIFEQIVGTLGALGVAGAVAWLGHAILSSLADMFAHVTK